MAYREFVKDQPIIVNDYSPIAQGLSDAGKSISGLFSAVEQAKKERALKADQYKVDLQQGKFENDDRLIQQLALDLKEEGKQLIKSGEGFNQDYNQRLAEAATFANSSKIQFDRMTQNLELINKRSADDKYYDPKFDEDIIREAVNGSNNEVNAFTRGERLAKAEQMIGKNPKAFRAHDYTADYVKNLGLKEMQSSSGTVNATNTLINKGRFFDDKTATFGVTDRHAVDFLNSRPDGSVKVYYEDQVNDDLSREIDTMKRAGDSRTEWMNGLSDIQIKNELIRNPSKNIINNTDFGIRVREKAKQALRDADEIQKKVDYQQKKDTSKTGGLYNNDAIAHSDTFFTEKVGTDNVSDQVAGAFRINQNSAPGGILMISKGANTGKPLPIESSSKNIFNVNSGTVQQPRGTAPFNLTGYNVQAYDKNGRPYFIEANNTEDLIKKINSIPYSEFKNLEPQMSVALRGYSLNKGKIMGDIRSSTYNLNEQLAQAKASNDIDKIDQIQNQLYELQQFSNELNSDEDDFTDDDILNAAARNGLTAVRTDQLIKADQSDLDQIRAHTQGLNLSDKNKWSPEMRMVANAFEKRAQEAATAGYASTGKKKSPAKKDVSSIPTISTDADYQKLPSGSEYIGPDGKKRIKK